MESLLDDVVGEMQTTNENLSNLQDRYFDEFGQQEPAYDKVVAPSCYSKFLCGYRHICFPFVI